MSCFKVLFHVSSALISASKAEYGLWPSSNHLNKYKNLLGADSQAIAEEPQSWNHVHVPKAYCKHEGRFTDVQDSPQVKQQHLGLLGPKVLAASPKLSSFCFDTSRLDTRKLLVWETAQREDPNTATAAEGNSSPGPRLGSRALQQDLALLCFPTACPGMNSERELRAVSFTTSLQGLTGQNTNVLSCMFSPLAQTHCWMRRPALPEGSGLTLSMSEEKRVWLNKTEQNLVLVFNPNTTWILIQATI